MKKQNTSVFRSISLLIFSIILILGAVFMLFTYLSATHFYLATTQRLNKDVAEHIARFTSPFSQSGLDQKKADSVFYDAMVLSPSIEVYFLDTTGKVMYFHAKESEIRLHQIPLGNIKKHISSKGLDYIKGPDPRNPGTDQVFSAAEVITNGKKAGYIYVILGGNDYRKVSGSLFDNHVLVLAGKILLVVLALSLLLSFLYLRRIRNSFRRVNKVLELFRNGDYSARLPTDSYNEFSVVAKGFNSMADTLVESIDRLEQSARERKDFVANISHDLRTPLSITRGYIDTLKDEIRKIPSDPDQQDMFISMASRKINQLESMVGQLFDLARMESADFKPQVEPLILSDIIEETVNNARKNTGAKEISLVCSGCQIAWWIRADTHMMERLVQNLIDNAVKYTPDGGHIVVTLERQLSNLEVSISNTGKKFSDQQLRWLNHDHNSNTILAKPHAGLGLAIVLKIIRLHEFEYKASIDNEGRNLFTIVIPLYQK